MQRGFLRLGVSVLAALALAACAVTEQQRVRSREAMTRHIVDDVVAYNDAYNAAISGQILLNILRAYNRQPRQYTSMSGFTNDDMRTRGTTLSIGSLPLGELGQEWGDGGLSIERGDHLEPDYKVEPFGAGDYSNIALRSTPTSVFRYYWDNGWNRDLLLFTMVDRMSVKVGRQTTWLNNSAGTIAVDCQRDPRPDVTDGCSFVRAVRTLANDVRRGAMVAAPAQPEQRAACYPVATYDRAAAPLIRAAPRANAPELPCPVTIIVGPTTYTLELRSLDDMIYYVGELLRADLNAPTQPPAGELHARLQVVAPGSVRERTPLFRIRPANAETERTYAATVTYAGQRYSAGAPTNFFCYDPRGADYCTGASAGDRSGTVLELLVGILAHNQSEAAVRAPRPRADD
jgi:hypothetical protein